MSDELVFSVSSSDATELLPVSLDELAFTERGHLQQWVLRHPNILGENVLVITFEFDQWLSGSGSAPRDRLDILALGSDGRLIVAELKRGRAPSTTDLQAIKYAAMASRFTEDDLAALHSAFCKKLDGQVLTEADALKKLEIHAITGLSRESLLQPRIVLLAEDFGEVLTASVVWLAEQGLDIALQQYRAYRLQDGQTVLTVSQFYPVQDAAEFEITPRRRATSVVTNPLMPVVPWTSEDLEHLAAMRVEVAHAILDLCSEHVDEWIAAAAAYDRAQVSPRSGRSKAAGFPSLVRSKFKRSNPPWTSEWGAAGGDQRSFKVDADTAQMWIAARDFNPH